MAYLDKKSKFPGDKVILMPANDYPVAFAKNEKEFGFYLRHLEELGLIAGKAPIGCNWVILTAKGWEKVEEIKKQGHDSNQCFLAMWFDDSMKDARDQGFLPAIKDAGFDPMVIDEKPHNGKICEEIIHEIKKSKFLVADVTGARGGVYYEAGFAKALGKDVIWTCRENRFTKDLHFDTRQYNHIKWTTPQDLKEKLEDQILGTIGRGKNKKD